jgi:hypothetical protein
LAPGVGLLADGVPACVVPSFVVCSLHIGPVEVVYSSLVGTVCSLILWAGIGVDFVGDL